MQIKHIKNIIAVLIATNSIPVLANDVLNKDFNIDTSIILKAGSRTKEQNEVHKKFCEMEGSIDITNQIDIKVTSGVSDAIMCLTSETHKYNKSTGSLNNNANLGVRVSTEAPSGHVGNGGYWIRGIVYYDDGQVGSNVFMEVGVKQDNCVASGSAAIQRSNGFGTMFATCSYPSGINPTISYMYGSLQGVSNISYGTIYHD